MRATSHPLTKGFISIRWTIPVFMVAPLIVGVGLTGWLAFRSGQKAINTLGEDLSSKMSALIEQQVKSYLAQPRTVHEGVLAAVESGNLNLNNVDAVQPYFWRLVQTYKLANYIYYGDQQGNFIGVEQQQDYMVAKIRTPATAPIRETTRLDSQGNATEMLERREYDPRPRPWYKVGLERGQATWSDIYIGASTGQLEFTWTTPITSNTGAVLGILGTDLPLIKISEFLQGLEISPSSQAFIVERSGELVATSTLDTPFRLEDDKKIRLSATETQNELVKAAAQRLVDQFGSFGQIPNRVFQSFEINGDRILVRTYSLQQSVELDWLIVVAIPEKDFMGTVHENTRTTLLVGSGITAIATLVGLLVALRITRPIGQLSQAARKIQSNSFEPDSLDGVICRRDEFGELATLFHDMASVIISREQSLAEQVEALRSEINKSSKLSNSELIELKTLLQRSQQTRGKL